MTNDNISDMLTRIRNASMAKHSFTRATYSKINLAILKVLLAEGYIKNYEIEEFPQKFLLISKNQTDQLDQSQTKQYVKKAIKIFLKYKGWWVKKSFFSIIKRVSKPGKRVFSSYKNFNDLINVLRYEQGIAIISTSSGIMSHLKATKLKKGGEILCYIG